MTLHGNGAGGSGHVTGFADSVGKICTLKYHRNENIDLCSIPLESRNNFGTDSVRSRIGFKFRISDTSHESVLTADRDAGGHLTSKYR